MIDFFHSGWSKKQSNLIKKASLIFHNKIFIFLHPQKNGVWFPHTIDKDQLIINKKTKKQNEDSH
jgi:hypothetical protein